MDHLKTEQSVVLQNNSLRLVLDRTRNLIPVSLEYCGRSLIERMACVYESGEAVTSQRQGPNTWERSVRRRSVPQSDRRIFADESIADFSPADLQINVDSATVRSESAHFALEKCYRFYDDIPVVGCRYSLTTKPGTIAEGPILSLPLVELSSEMQNPWLSGNDRYCEPHTQPFGLVRPGWRLCTNPSREWGLAFVVTTVEQMDLLNVLHEGISFQSSLFETFKFDQGILGWAVGHADKPILKNTEISEFLMVPYQKNAEADLLSLFEWMTGRQTGGSTVWVGPKSARPPADQEIPPIVNDLEQLSVTLVPPGTESLRIRILKDDGGNIQVSSSNSAVRVGLSDIRSENEKYEEAEVEISVDPDTAPGVLKSDLAITFRSGKKCVVPLQVTAAAPLGREEQSKAGGVIFAGQKAAAHANLSEDLWTVRQNVPGAPDGQVFQGCGKRGDPFSLDPDLRGWHTVHIGLWKGPPEHSHAEFLGIKAKLSNQPFFATLTPSRQSQEAFPEVSLGPADLTGERIEVQPMSDYDTVYVSHIRFVPLTPEAVSEFRRLETTPVSFPLLGLSDTFDIFYKTRETRPVEIAEDLIREKIAGFSIIALQTTAGPAMYPTEVGISWPESASRHNRYWPPGRATGRFISKHDPLKIAVETCHTIGVELWGWMRPHSTVALGDRYPELLERTADGALFARAWMGSMPSCPPDVPGPVTIASPEGRDHFINLLAEQVEYGVSGFFIDVHRHPPWISYPTPAVEAYQERFGTKPPALQTPEPENAKNSQWLRHRAAYVTDLLRLAKEHLSKRAGGNIAFGIRVRPRFMLYDGIALDALIAEQLIDLFAIYPYSDDSVVDGWDRAGTDPQPMLAAWDRDFAAVEPFMDTMKAAGIRLFGGTGFGNYAAKDLSDAMRHMIDKGVDGLCFHESNVVADVASQMQVFQKAARGLL